jgi:tRNA pseudouridine13 synthase
VLCLDLGGVVVRICRSWREGCEAAGVPHSAPKAESDPAFLRERARLVDVYQRGELQHDEFVAAMSAAFGGAHTPDEVDRIHGAWILGDYPEMLELLREVKALGIRVACLSNTNQVHWQHMHETSDAFNAIEIRHASHLLGMNKPHPDIYRAFEAATGFHAAEILFADDLPENIEAARSLGWNAVHIDHAGSPAEQIARALTACGVPLRGNAASTTAAGRSTCGASPLVSRTLLCAEGPGGLIKVRSDDFLVDELPLYEPSGEGEHLFIAIQKSDMTHEELVKTVARHFGVSPRDVGYAGRKDKRAVTRQVLSVNLPGAEPAAQLTHERLEVLWTARHKHKLRLGHLAGNRFVIRVRNVDPLQVPSVHKRLQHIARVGMPNAFGSQRFGFRQDGHLLGACCLLQKWDALVDHLLSFGDGTVPFPSHQQAAREACAQGRFGDAVPLWGESDHAERRVTAALARGAKASRAVKNLGGEQLRYWISAWQSAVFNRVLRARLDDGSWNEPRDGDVMQVGDTSRCFLIGAEDNLEEVRRRCAAFETTPTGPLPGTSVRTPTGTTAHLELSAMQELGVSSDQMTCAAHAPTGDRRALRAAVRAASIESGVDEHGGFFLLRFELPAGSFATTLLREVLGSVEEAAHDSN